MSKAKTAIVNNVKYLIKNNKDIIENTLLKGNQWNNDVLLLLGLLIKKYKLKHLVNVGSHIGTVALPISKYIEKVTAFEPFPPTFRHFMEHVKLNKIKNIESYNLALGDRETKVYFLDPNHERFKNNSGGMPAVTDDDINVKSVGGRLNGNSEFIMIPDGNHPGFPNCYYFFGGGALGNEDSKSGPGQFFSKDADKLDGCDFDLKLYPVFEIKRMYKL